MFHWFLRFRFNKQLSSEPNLILVVNDHFKQGSHVIKFPSHVSIEEGLVSLAATPEHYEHTHGYSQSQGGIDKILTTSKEGGHAPITTSKEVGRAPINHIKGSWPRPNNHLEFITGTLLRLHCKIFKLCTTIVQGRALLFRCCASAHVYVTVYIPSMYSYTYQILRLPTSLLPPILS